jgi:hypothetical protein
MVRPLIRAHSVIRQAKNALTHNNLDSPNPGFAVFRGRNALNTPHEGHQNLRISFLPNYLELRYDSQNQQSTPYRHRPVKQAKPPQILRTEANLIEKLASKCFIFSGAFEEFITPKSLTALPSKNSQPLPLNWKRLTTNPGILPEQDAKKTIPCLSCRVNLRRPLATRRSSW